MDSLTTTIDPTLMRAQTRVGTVLREKWRLDRLLGVGGMAAVYAATHRNGTRAAVKILHPEFTTHGHVRSRFLKEGHAANKVDHHGVVRVLDDDVAEDGSLYLVMELLDGESLEERRLRMGSKLDVDEVLAAADQILDVLAAAHDKGIVHRDIKPENIFLTRDGVIKVLDFGIARLRELSTASSATRVGSTMGTPCYMSPEHARGLWDEVDAQSDLWSVGATMFTLLTGRVVHPGRTTNEQLVAAITQRAPAVSSVLPDTPKPVSDVVDRALAYEKAERWPDARTMQETVRRTFHGLHGAPISTHPKLTVPPTVPNRTLPSADVQVLVGMGSAGTGPAVSAGSTGVPLRSSVTMGVPRGVLVAIGIAGGAIVFVVAIVAVALGVARKHGSADTAAAAQPPASVALSATPVSEMHDASAAPAITAPSTPVVALEDLPTSSPGKRIPNADAGPKTGATPQTGAEWKEKRK